MPSCRITRTMGRVEGSASTCRSNERDTHPPTSTATGLVMISRIAVSCLVCVSLSTETGAQPPASVKSDWTLLAKGWTAIAVGKPDEAVAVANQILKRRPGSHGALMLKIEGLAAGARPLLALDAYEEWLTSPGEQVED